MQFERFYPLNDSFLTSFSSFSYFLHNVPPSNIFFQAPIGKEHCWANSYMFKTLIRDFLNDTHITVKERLLQSCQNLCCCWNYCY